MGYRQHAVRSGAAAQFSSAEPSVDHGVRYYHTGRPALGSGIGTGRCAASRHVTGFVFEQGRGGQLTIRVLLHGFQLRNLGAAKGRRGISKTAWVSASSPGKARALDRKLRQRSRCNIVAGTGGQWRTDHIPGNSYAGVLQCFWGSGNFNMSDI